MKVQRHIFQKFTWGGNLRLLSIILLSTLLSSAFAEVAPKGYSDEQAKEYQEYNDKLWLQELTTPKLFLTDVNEEYVTINKPFSEYQTTKYVVINDGTGFDSGRIKQILAKNLPENVTLVVITSSQYNHTNVKHMFGNYVKGNRLKILTLGQAEGTFWARDALPVPVITAQSKLSLVDAYYSRFFQDQDVANYFQAGYLKHNYRYEGGNFMPNDQGVCLAINRVHLSKQTYENYYGCRKIILLPFSAGIGHIDERVKFLSDDIVVTDTESYRNVLEDNGFTVIMLPNNKFGHETYANSLLVNGTIFMPTYGRTNDAVAQRVYEDQGLKVVPIRTSLLSNKGLGSIHCITMGYPDINFEDLAQSLER